MKVDYPNLVSEKDRHGNPRYYVRRKEAGRLRRVRICATLGTAEFDVAYRAAVDALKVAPFSAAPRIKKATHGTLGWLAAEYFDSATFRSLDAKSQRARRGVIEGCLREPVTPGSKRLMRDCPYLRVDPTHIMMFRDRKVKAGMSGAANNRRKYLGSMFSWAIEARKYGIKSNPCRDARRAQVVTDGYYTWTLDDVLKFVGRHPPGTTAYLFMSLMLFLGARRQDAIRLGPKNIQTIIVQEPDGTHVGRRSMVYVPKKTSYRRVDESVKPILAPLDRALSMTPTGIDTFIVTAHGKPFTDAGIGNRVREWCDQAALPECTAHGLKKIAATLCAEAGATNRQMMDLFDWSSEAMAIVYTRKANKRRLAADASGLLGGSFSWERLEAKASTDNEGRTLERDRTALVTR